MGCGAVIGAPDGPFGDRVIGGEVFDGFSRREVDIDRVELNDGAGFCGL